MKREICKLQRPLMTNEPIPVVLVYNEDESIRTQLPLTKEMNGLFDGEYKIYRYCRLDKKGLLHIDEQAPEQAW